MHLLHYLLFLTIWSINVEGHGRLLEPPGRSSLWRFSEFKKYHPVTNYNDHELYCGGFAVQYNQNNKGRCGVCGDRFDDQRPRANENGGRYGQGVIVRTYKSGQVIPISVQMTKAHWGHFEFHLCPHNMPNTKVPEDESCFDKYTLEFGDGRGTGGTKYPVDKSADDVFYNSTVKLPPGLKCQQCVLRWHYRTGNSWGTCPDGSGAIGCGDQETFRGCSDIEII